jgi:DNA mismatch repair ATPase MutS
VLARFERESFASTELVSVRRRLSASGQLASRRIAGLRRLIDLLNSRQNQIFAPVAAITLWGAQVAFAIERWRRVSGPHLADWIEGVGELEALCSLAGYAYERPSDPFAEIVEDGALFEAEALSHPLIPPSRAVPNSVALGGTRQMLLVSGSNMSGKSTLLRTVGVNAVLALAGAPVRAACLRLSPLAVGATLRVQDSLAAGQSRFYAEITRVRTVVALTGESLPVLFLLDELLSGTNSHDRQQGAEAIVRGLLDRGAIGLVTTHDLALSGIAERLAPRAENVHFADEFDGGTLRFDYRMRPGVVKTSNAIQLMRAVGLDV